MGRLRVHTTNLVSGIVFVLLGTVFIAYEGTSALSGLYETYGAVDVAYAAEQWTRSFANSVPDALLAVVLAAVLILAIVAYRRRRRKPRGLTGASDDSVEEIGKRPDRASR